MSVIAVIPAKGFSRRLPEKNVRTIGGLPLFVYSVKTALETEGIDQVIVSSDSDIILALAQQYGARAMKRPAALCTDEATNFQVLKDLCTTLRTEGHDPDLLVLLQPTTPYRRSCDLAHMLTRLMQNNTADSLVTVTPITRILGNIVDGYWQSVSGAIGPKQRIKPAEALFGISGHAFLLRPKRTLDCGTLLGQHILAEQLPNSWPDIDIDTPEDWTVALAYAASITKQDG